MLLTESQKEKRRIACAKWRATHLEHARAMERASYRKHRAKRVISGRLHYLKNMTRINAYTTKWRVANPEKVNAARAKWAKANPDKIREAERRRRKLHPEKVLERVKRYQARHPERVRLQSVRYRKENPERVRQTKRESQRRLMAKSVEARIKHSLRTRILAALLGKRTAKADSSVKLLGCSIPFFRAHLECQWKPGMSWENYGKGEGKWNVDHVRPCASFDLEQPIEQRRCFHFTNTQPLWHEDNNRKGCTYPIDERIAA